MQYKAIGVETIFTVFVALSEARSLTEAKRKAVEFVKERDRTGRPPVYPRHDKYLATYDADKDRGEHEGWWIRVIARKKLDTETVCQALTEP